MIRTDKAYIVVQPQITSQEYRCDINLCAPYKLVIIAMFIEVWLYNLYLLCVFFIYLAFQNDLVNSFDGKIYVCIYFPLCV